MNNKHSIPGIIVIALGMLGLIALSVNTGFLFPKYYLEVNGTDAVENLTAVRYFVQEGMLPYRDLYTTGGVSVYLLMAIGYLVSGETGIWIIQLFAVTASLWIISLITNKMPAFHRILVFSLYFILCMAAFSLGAGSLEFALPWMFYTNWYALTEEDENRSFWQDALMVLCFVILLFNHVALGLIAGSVLLLCKGKSRQNHAKLIMGSVSLLFVTLGILWYSGMLLPWLRMIPEYYIPTLQKQITYDKAMLHRLVKVSPTFLLFLAAFCSEHRKKRVYYIISGLMLLIFLLSGNDDWFRYGILIAYVPFCYVTIYNCKKERKILLFSFLLLWTFIVPLKRTAALYYSQCIKGEYKDELHDILSWDDPSYDDQMLCLDTSTKYYLLLNKKPASRYYTRQSELCIMNLELSNYMVEYLWNDEFKGNLFLYHSSSGWCPESVNHYQCITFYNCSEYIAIYEWSDTVITEDEHDHEDVDEDQSEGMAEEGDDLS